MASHSRSDWARFKFSSYVGEFSEPAVGGVDREVESYVVSEVVPVLESMVEPVVESPLIVPMESVVPIVLLDPVESIEFPIVLSVGDACVVTGVVTGVVLVVIVSADVAAPERSSLFFELVSAKAFTETNNVAHR